MLMCQVTVVYRDGVRKKYDDLRVALSVAWNWRQLDEAEDEMYRLALIPKMLHPRNKRKRK